VGVMILGPDSTCEISYLAILLQVEPQETQRMSIELG
jgi:hypothetical protein